MDKDISLEEVRSAIKSVNKGKASGEDNIPVEVLANEQCIRFLHKLFNISFSTGIIPEVWKKGIIQPILKGNELNAKVTSNYRGITLVCSAYKLYSHILLKRLESFCDDHDVICDEQNGFRKSRSCVEQLLTLTDIVQSRIHVGCEVFVCFLDFSKAYDRVNRDLLWNRLANIGVGTKYLDAMRSSYGEVTSCVRINGKKTDWFYIGNGVKQGCLLSPTLFNIYINTLVESIKQLNAGVKLDGGKSASILAYADDIVLISNSHEGLQSMMTQTDKWCKENCMQINAAKTKIMHFRKTSRPRTLCEFQCGNDVIEIVTAQKYLGLHLNEHLDFNYTTKKVAQSATRCFGLLVAKFKHFGGLPFEVYTKLYDALVDSVIRYSSCIWGYRAYSHISAVQNRACRFFLGVGKYTPNAAVQGDMGWLLPEHRQWKSVATMWYRMENLEPYRINYVVHSWARRLALARTKNWCYHVQTFFNKLEIGYEATRNNISKSMFIHSVNSALTTLYNQKWQEQVNRPDARRQNGGNKLRTYKNFKDEFHTEDYVIKVKNRRARASLAKFRCGTAPIHLETGRYMHLPVEQRVCLFGCDQVETETHVLVECSVYDEIRADAWDAARNYDTNFDNMDSHAKLNMLMHMPNITVTAKLCNDILNERRKLLMK